MMERLRLCVCYVITTLLMTSFIYMMLSGNLSNSQNLRKLKDEVDEMAQIVLGNAAVKGEPSYLSETIESVIKKRLSVILDDIYSMKKQIKSNECSNFGGQSLTKALKESTQLTGDHRVNYASESLGAKVLSVKAEPFCNTGVLQSIFGLQYSSNPPIQMLKSSMEPGHCFAFKNDKADIVIQLSHAVLIDNIAIQHIPKNKSPTEETLSAPKDFTVYAQSKTHEQHLIGNFRYDNLPNQPFQSFPVKVNEKYRVLRFHFDTNHGHPNYTCIYRIAVYGKI